MQNCTFLVLYFQGSMCTPLPLKNSLATLYAPRYSTLPARFALRYLLYCFFTPLDKPVMSTPPCLSNCSWYFFKLSPSHNFLSIKSCASFSCTFFIIHHCSVFPKVLYVRYSLSMSVSVLLFRRLHRRATKNMASRIKKKRA